MKKFGFRTTSITFKALCIILPIQFLFLILGYRHVQDLIFEAENEKREKFESEKSALEEILKEYPALSLAKFSKFSTQKENKSLKAQVQFLKEQLQYKTFGKPTHDEDK